jgi:hypothetical protein
MYVYVAFRLIRILLLMSVDHNYTCIAILLYIVLDCLKVPVLSGDFHWLKSFLDVPKVYKKW